MCGIMPTGLSGIPFFIMDSSSAPLVVITDMDSITGVVLYRFDVGEEFLHILSEIKFGKLVIKDISWPDHSTLSINFLHVDEFDKYKVEQLYKQFFGKLMQIKFMNISEEALGGALSYDQISYGLLESPPEIVQVSDACEGGKFDISMSFFIISTWNNVALEEDEDGGYRL